MIKEYISDAIYIVYDGTSAYEVYGCDVQEEIDLNDVEVLKGPIADTPSNQEKIEMWVEKYNTEINESKTKSVRKINESQLRTIVAESVKKVLNEWYILQ